LEDTLIPEIGPAAKVRTVCEESLRSSGNPSPNANNTDTAIKDIIPRMMRKLNKNRSLERV
jgi:hypothetical protein